jgi:hypothetical protein
MEQLRKPSIVTRALAGVCAFATATSLLAAPAAAFADENMVAPAAVGTEGYVTAAACRAASPLPEILGISNVEESGQFSNTVDWPNSVLDWANPQYHVFGTNTYNADPNPYMVNAVANDGTMIVYNPSRSAGGGGPSGGLAVYGVDESDDQVWNLLPDVIIGTGGTIDYYTSSAAAASAMGVDGYMALGVPYTLSNTGDMILSMYNAAAAADAVVAASDGSKRIRYADDASCDYNNDGVTTSTEIALMYEEYIKGIQGAILGDINGNAAVEAVTGDNYSAKRSVVIISGYDSLTGTWTVVPATATGTQRYLEAVGNVANVLSPGTLNDTSLYAASTQQLLDADADLLVYSGSPSEDALTALNNSGLLSKTFYVGTVESTLGSSSPGSCYGTTMQSVENAQNFGRILGCLYPNIVNQDNMMQYYYDCFYHLNDATIVEAMQKMCNGITRYANGMATNWSTFTGTGYNQNTIQAKLDAGVKYLAAWGEGPTVVTPQLEAAAVKTGAPATGDINGNSTVEMTEVIMALRCSINVERLSSGQLAAADINGSGYVEMTDVIQMLRLSVGLTS